MPAFGCAVVYLKFPSSPGAPGAFAVGRSDLVGRKAVQADARVRDLERAWLRIICNGMDSWYMFQLKELTETPKTCGPGTVCRPGKCDLVLSLVL